MLISFCIEAWFTSGQGMAKGLQWFYIQSWLASTVTTIHFCYSFITNQICFLGFLFFRHGSLCC